LPSPTVWAALGGLAMLSTALAYVLYFRILAAAGATNLLLVTFLIPVTAILLGAAVLGERLAPRPLRRNGPDRAGPRRHRRPDRALATPRENSGFGCRASIRGIKSLSNWHFISPSIVEYPLFAPDLRAWSGRGSSFHAARTLPDLATNSVRQASQTAESGYRIRRLISAHTVAAARRVPDIGLVRDPARALNAPSPGRHSEPIRPRPVMPLHPARIRRRRVQNRPVT